MTTELNNYGLESFDAGPQSHRFSFSPEAQEVLLVAQAEAARGRRDISRGEVFIALASVYPTRAILEPLGITPEYLREVLEREQPVFTNLSLVSANQPKIHIDTTYMGQFITARLEREGRSVIEPRDLLRDIFMRALNPAFGRIFQERRIATGALREEVLRQLDSIITITPESSENR